MAYLLPLFQSLLTKPKLQSHAFSPQVLILTLNRQLESQILSSISRLSVGTNLVSLIYPIPMGLPLLNFKNPCFILSTPRSLRHAHKSPRSLDRFLSNTQSVIFDEADAILQTPEGERLLQEISRINRKLHPIQTLFCGASLPRVFSTKKSRKPGALIDRWMPDLEWQVCDPESMNPLDRIKEEFIEFSPDTFEQGSMQVLEILIEEDLKKGGKWLLFCNSLEYLERMHQRLASLKRSSVRVFCVHGHQTQPERGSTLEEFGRLRKEGLDLCLTTGLLARGIDVPGVTRVINLQEARHPIEHGHRIGRCGRAGANGHALTFKTLAVE